MAGYSGTPLVKKLGIRSGMSAYIYQSPEEYLDWLSPLPEQVHFIKTLQTQIDFIHLFVKDQNTLHEKIGTAKRHLSKNGMMWISWPKKASKVSTDLDENVVRNAGLNEGLVDVKVCAVSETWSGLKFVFRLKDR